MLRHTRQFSGAVALRIQASRQGLAVRPVVKNANQPPPNNEQPPRRFGLLFLLAGACLATWLIKPTYKPPKAAFDPIRRRICIVFVFGTPNAADIATLQSRGFTYIQVTDPNNAEAQLQPLVSSGKTWLAISGVPQQAINQFEQKVVQCDLALAFGTSSDDLKVLNERLVTVDKQPLAEILDTKNM